MKQTILFFILALLNKITAGQSVDTMKTSQDAIYNRPFIHIGKSNTAVGGYIEGNTNYFSEDGITSGFSMELKRFNVFIYSKIHSQIKFISELEFEHGTEEINIETALLDFEFNPSFNFRAGILLPPIGMVNTNHDSPKWEFIERPLSSTEIIPTTLSEVGFGLHGKFFSSNTIYSYDFYLVNGLQDRIILNNEGKTHLKSGKSSEMFGSDNNGMPMISGKITLVNRTIGEIGISYYGGIYNRFRLEGNVVDKKRMLSVIAFDFNTQIRKLNILGEYARVFVDVPENLSELYGKKQYGTFLELSYPILKRKMIGFENALLNMNMRGERIDYNIGTFKFDRSNIRDEVNALALGISFRPSASTVVRANYRYHWIYDVIGNPAIHFAGFQFGIASYF